MREGEGGGACNDAAQCGVRATPIVQVRLLRDSLCERQGAGGRGAVGGTARARAWVLLRDTRLNTGAGRARRGRLSY